MFRLSHGACVDRRLVSLPVLLLALLGACVSSGGGARTGQVVADEAADPNDTPASVVVDNRSWDQVTVYLTQGTAVWRLGDVAAMTQRTLPLRHVGGALVGRNVQFIARRLSGPSFRSESFSMSAGMGIPMWTIANQSAFSYVLFR